MIKKGIIKINKIVQRELGRKYQLTNGKSRDRLGAEPTESCLLGFFEKLLLEWDPDFRAAECDVSTSPDEATEPSLCELNLSGSKL